MFASAQTQQEPLLVRFLNSASVRFNQFFCGMTGHKTTLKVERERIYLRCMECGHTSPGWEVGKKSR